MGLLSAIDANLQLLCIYAPMDVRGDVKLTDVPKLPTAQAGVPRRNVYVSTGGPLDYHDSAAMTSMN